MAPQVVLCGGGLDEQGLHTHCGRVKADLVGDKTFQCPVCGVRYDRDAGAARNILLRYFSLNELPSVEGSKGQQEQERP